MESWCGAGALACPCDAADRPCADARGKTKQQHPQRVHAPKRAFLLLLLTIPPHQIPFPYTHAAVTGPRKDFTTGESIFGELRGGTLVRVSTALARRLLQPGCALLAGLGSGIPFELAVGLNGLVWVNAGAPQHVIAVANAIERAEFLDEEQCAALAAAAVKEAGR